MGLDFTKPEPLTQTAQAMPTAAVPMAASTSTELMERPKEYSIEADLAQMERQMVNSEEVDRIASTIDVWNNDTIITFGQEAAEELGKASDIVLADMNRAALLEGKSFDLMGALAKIFNDIDINEIQKDPGLFGRLFGDLKKKIEKFLAKYQNISVEIDKIYVELKRFEEEARAANRKLNTLFDANVTTFHEMKKYIFAGEQGIRELEEYIAKLEREYQETNNNELTFDLQKLRAALELLQARVYDLRTAENVALQSIPQIKMQELTNYNVIRKINTNFIITLPIFKQAIAQAVMLKRQKIQTEALAELDKKTNELLVRNAQNTVEVAKNAARLASNSSISAETLEQTWKTITTGIEEVNKIQADAKKNRIEGTAKLENIKKDFYQKFGAPKTTVRQIN